MIFVADIQRAVAEHYGEPYSIMRERDGFGSRVRSHVRPRQLAMCLASRLTEQAMTDIGRRFGGRDHSTVIYAVKVVEERAKSDPETSATLRKLTLSLCQHPRFHRSETTALAAHSEQGA